MGPRTNNRFSLLDLRKSNRSNKVLVTVIMKISEKEITMSKTAGKIAKMKEIIQ
jgi:hypothetical protein